PGRSGRDDGKCQFETAACRAANVENACLPRAKRDPVAAVAVEQDVAAGQRGVAAEANFASRCEPAELPIRRSGFIANDEGRLGKLVFFADRLEHLVRKPRLERHDGGLVAGERAVGKGVDMPVRDGQLLHGLLSSLANSSASTSLFPGSSMCPSGSM